MRIVHVIRTLDPAAGGPPAVVTRLASAQAALGHHTCIVSYSTEAAAAVAQALAAVPGIDRVERIELPRPDRIERILARSARRHFAGLLTQADIFHLHGVWDPIIKAAADVARGKRPYVVAPHGMLDPWSLRQSSLKKRIALSLGYREMLNRAAFLHVLNSDEGTLLAPLRLTSPTRVIPNGIFPDELIGAAGDDVFRRAHPQLGDARYVLFLSRIHYKKGLDYLADAFVVTSRRWPDVWLVVAGPDDGARADFEHRIARAGLQHRVLLPGPLYGPQKIAALRGAACFCLPSRQEGFSMAITESMACGTPVVISEQCHFPEVGTAKAGIIVPLEAAAIARAVEDVLSDAERARSMGEAGRQLVHQKYTWPRIADASTALYADVLAGRLKDAVPAV